MSEPRFYINRDSETGEWYTATPVYYENDSRVRTDVVIEILLDGEAVALDGNGTFDGKRPFVPFHQFRERVTKLLMDKYPALKGYGAMKEMLLSLPGGERYADSRGIWENWSMIWTPDAGGSRSRRMPTGWDRSTTSSRCRKRTGPPALCSQISDSGRQTSRPALPAATCCSTTGRHIRNDAQLEMGTNNMPYGITAIKQFYQTAYCGERTFPASFRKAAFYRKVRSSWSNTIFHHCTE